MIIVNYPPGGLGFLILKCIKYHVNGNTGLAYNSLDNHDVQPDLFLRNQTDLDAGDLEQLEHLIGRPSLVLSHNADLVPGHIRQGCKVFDITCNPNELASASFLFFVKSGKFIYDYVLNNQQNLYQGIYLQILRMQQTKSATGPDVQIPFGELDDLHNLEPLLKAAAAELGADLRPLDRDWYRNQYQRSMAPFDLHWGIYQKFRSAWFDIAQHGQPNLEVTKVLPPAVYKDFADAVDFLYLIQDY